MQKYNLLLTFFFFLSFSFSLSAQENVKQVISDLKKGVLMVRLPTNSNKQKAIEGYLQDPKLTPIEQVRWEKELASTKEDTKLLTTRIVEAIAKRYTFSNYTFIYDTAVGALLKGNTKGLFFDKNLVSTNLSLENTPFFLLKYGKMTNSTGFIVANKDNQDLDKKWAISIHLSQGEFYSGLLFAASTGITLDDVPSARKIQKAIRMLNANLSRR
ncbi:MAG: hypothetical protein RLZZ292_2880 [Bacteroidota bacterium]|jgi:hypothetical protein